jgi:hypothetical protein
MSTVVKDVKEKRQLLKNLESELSSTYQDTVKREAVICYSESGEGVRVGRNEVGISMNGNLIGGYMVSLNPIGSNKEVGLNCNSENSNITYFQQDTVSLIDRRKLDIQKLEDRIKRNEEQMKRNEKQIQRIEDKLHDLEFQERINRNR